MITKDEARIRSLFHYGTCTRTVGPRGGVTDKIEQWRENGNLREWKRDPSRWELPLKYGMRSYGTMHPGNADLFHLPEDCPIMLA